MFSIHKKSRYDRTYRISISKRELELFGTSEYRKSTGLKNIKEQNLYKNILFSDC